MQELFYKLNHGAIVIEDEDDGPLNMEAAQACEYAVIYQDRQDGDVSMEDAQGGFPTGVPYIPAQQRGLHEPMTANEANTHGFEGSTPLPADTAADNEAQSPPAAATAAPAQDEMSSSEESYAKAYTLEQVDAIAKGQSFSAFSEDQTQEDTAATGTPPKATSLDDTAQSPVASQSSAVTTATGTLAPLKTAAPGDAAQSPVAAQGQHAATGTPLTPTEAKATTLGHSHSTEQRSRSSARDTNASTPQHTTKFGTVPSEGHSHSAEQRSRSSARDTNASTGQHTSKFGTASSEGVFRICEEVRNKWNDKVQRGEVLEMMKKCGDDPEIFQKRYSITVENEREEQMQIPFETDIAEVIKRAETNPQKYIRHSARAKYQEHQEVEAQAEGIHMDLSLDLHSSHCAPTQSEISAASQALMSPEAKEEWDREATNVLKKLGFPMVESLNTEGIAKQKQQRASNSTTDQKGSIQERMLAKVKLVYDKMENLVDQLGDLQTEGCFSQFIWGLGIADASEVVQFEGEPDLMQRAALEALAQSVADGAAGRLARAFTASGQQTSAVHAAARISEANGERDSQRLFRRFNMILPVPRSRLEVTGSEESRPTQVPFLKLSDYLQVLLKKHPKLIFGGKEKGEAAERLLELFWERYRLAHPGHIAFQKCTADELRFLIPLQLHGDKGRGRLSWTCSQRAREHVSAVEVPNEDTCSLKRRKLDDGEFVESLQHNSRGHSFLTRFLISAIPAKVFRPNPLVIESLFSELQKDLCHLFESGVVVEGITYKACLIGVKGDNEFLMEAGRFNRHYAHVGTVHDNPMCPYCLAGTEGVEFSDFSDRPVWASTLYDTEPWDAPPPLVLAPFAEHERARLFRRDMFHILKYGFLKDLCAGALFLLCRMTYFDDPLGGESLEQDCRLGRAYGLFSLWCLAEGKATTLRRFSKGSLHRKKATQYPFIGGKGADTVLLMQFLHFFVALCKKDMRVPGDFHVLHALHETLTGALDFLGIMHSHGIFLTLECARLQHSL
ncbi:unnamed protein product [Symbiodinium natans]|uniref:Uncharacterized protein n=1 Tax=Symbiodinium natans TaxID=878477 RepID=A0A812TZ90_9DINO|nr:unnamed protein product [Symbiodinium natans]